ncbi:hypothetical protein [Sphingomonas sp. CARO-RG-8B-R24-01]|uniref:hypothetical protein n=1 Tax=Sphingomonas sp. CARO-RG-8B-R24-01 TaxID=2914831 RepID=UPI001F57009A|nr:hypothetical protein [Sphingomonas sp. CARO-RG-8B-R24-01]
MRYLLILACVLTATPVDAATNNIPMVAIGLPFEPESPTPVDRNHVLYHHVEVGDIEGLPTTVGSSSLNFIRAAKRSSVNAALRETFDRMNFLSPARGTAHVRLLVSWEGSTTPFHIGAHNRATATLRYRLVRIDTARVLFDRSITTSVAGGGVDASMRDNGIVRAAIATNFASAANCIDHAAYGTAPSDCALIPKFSVSVVRR